MGQAAYGIYFNFISSKKYIKHARWVENRQKKLKNEGLRLTIWVGESDLTIEIASHLQTDDNLMGISSNIFLFVLFFMN